jgi:hypothetical protein
MRNLIQYSRPASFYSKGPTKIKPHISPASRAYNTPLIIIASIVITVVSFYTADNRDDNGCNDD